MVFSEFALAFYALRAQVETSKFMHTYRVQSRVLVGAGAGQIHDPIPTPMTHPTHGDHTYQITDDRQIDVLVHQGWTIKETEIEDLDELGVIDAVFPRGKFLED